MAPFEKIPFMMVCSCGLSSVHSPADFTWCRGTLCLTTSPELGLAFLIADKSANGEVHHGCRSPKIRHVRSGAGSAGVSCPEVHQPTMMGRRCGSRPRRYHRRHIKPKTPIGRTNGQLDRRKKPVNFSELGSMTSPLSQPTTPVSP